MKTSTAMQTLPTPKGMATQTSRNASTVSAAGRRSTPSASPAPRKKPSPAPVAAVTKRRTPTPPADDLNESGFGNDYEYEHHATPSPPKRRTPVKQQAAGSKPRGRPVGGGVSKAKPTAVKPATKKEKPVKVSKPRQPREKAVYVAPRSGLAEAVLNESTTGARRSSRRMFRPLQYWRNERVVYEREKGGGKLLPEVVDVLIRSPDTVAAPRRRK
jgi:centromere protein C